jgi:hypothetical protein
MRRLLICAILGVTVLGGATACGFQRQGDVVGQGAGQAEDAASFTPEGEALAAMGFDPQDIAAGEPAFAGAAVAGGVAAAVGGESASPQPQATGRNGHRKFADWRKRRAMRVLLAHDTLHGEAVVQTKDGKTITVVVQRGVITELTDTSVTVTSADGFMLTWTFSDRLRVVEKRRSVQPSAVEVGMRIGIAGAKNGEGQAARFIVIPIEK